MVNGNAISWESRSQKTFSLASSHEEYNAVSELCRDILHIKYIMDFINCKPNLPIIIYCDNSGAIFLRNNQETKLRNNFDIKVHFIRSYVKDGTVKIVFVKSENNLADSYTKTSGYESYIKNQSYMSNVCIDV